jgi:hypothetical protein
VSFSLTDRFEENGNGSPPTDAQDHKKIGVIEFNHTECSLRRAKMEKQK